MIMKGSFWKGNIKKLLKCDVIILTIPVDAIISFMPMLKKVKKKTTIIDFGSTKKLIVENIPKKLRKQFL